MYSVPETRIQDPTFVVTLPTPDANSFSRFTLRVSGDPVSSARGQGGVEIVRSVHC